MATPQKRKTVAKHLNGGSLLARIKASASAAPHEVVEMPEWGGEVIVRAIDTATALTWGDTEAEGLTAIARQIYMSVYQPNGERVFESTEQAEEVISGIPFGLTNRLLEVVGRLNGTSSDERQKIREGFTQADAGARSSR